MENKMVTKNNITIYDYPSPHVHSFCINLYIKAGTLYERSNESGISHFLEHIHFRNLEKLYHNDFYTLLDSMGVYFKACTYKDFMYFSISGVCKHFDKSAEMLAGVLSPLLVSKEETDRERERIKREITENDKVGGIEHITDRQAWKGTPLDRLITGSLSDVSKISLKALKEKKDELFVNENIFFYVTGSYNEQNIAQLAACIERYDLKQGRVQEANLQPRDFGQRDCKVFIKNNYYTYLSFTFDIDFSKYSYCEIALLYDILFASDTCRFNTVLSYDESLIYDYTAHIQLYGSLSSYSVHLESELPRLYDTVKAAIVVFKSVKTQLTEKQLSAALPLHTDNSEMLLDMPSDLNWQMAYQNHILGEKYSSLEQLKETYKSITLERLQQVAKEIFTCDNLIITLKGDKKQISGYKIKEIAKELD